MLDAAIDIRRWLEADRHTPLDRRMARDRAIGRSLEASGDLRRVLAWWRRIQGEGQSPGAAVDAGPALDSPAASGHRVVALRRLAIAVLVAVGLLLGAALAGIGFAYDGRHPVNLFTLFGVFVALPGLMLLLTLLLLPGRLPGTGTAAGTAGFSQGLRGVIAGLNLGRWAGAAIDRYLGAALFAPGPGAPLGLRTFARWQLVVFSQWFALGFFAGVLGMALLLVTFTDLAFGWSTTLRTPAADVHRWLALLALPWSAWLPQGAPDLALVEASRYFRGEQIGMAPDRVARLGEWWPFVFMTIVVYGLLPRLVLLVLAQWRLSAATGALLRDDPEVTALLDRLDRPLLGLAGEGTPETLPTAATPVAAPQPSAVDDDTLALVWNQAIAPDQVDERLGRWLGAAPAAVLELGELHSEAERHAALAAALPAGARGRRSRLIVLTKGWEPPLLAFGDFLEQVRERLGSAPSITIVPLDVSRDRVRAEDRAVWAAALARLRDPRLYVLEATP